MKKVVWPDRRTTAVFTVVVLSLTAAITLVMWVVDLVLTKAFSLFFHVGA